MQVSLPLLHDQLSSFGLQASILQQALPLGRWPKVRLLGCGGITPKSRRLLLVCPDRLVVLWQSCDRRFLDDLPAQIVKSHAPRNAYRAVT